MQDALSRIIILKSHHDSKHRHDTEKEQPQESRYQHYVIMFHKPFNVHE